jgi:hypothetical protein
MKIIQKSERYVEKRGIANNAKLYFFAIRTIRDFSKTRSSEIILTLRKHVLMRSYARLKAEKFFRNELPDTEVIEK